MSIRPIRGMALGLTAALMTAGALTAAAGSASAETRWGCGAPCGPNNTITMTQNETVNVNTYIDNFSHNHNHCGPCWHPCHHWNPCHHWWDDDDDDAAGMPMDGLLGLG